MPDINPVDDPSTTKNSDQDPKSTTVDVRPVVSPPSDPHQKQIRSNQDEFERLFKVDEDALDQPTTTRKELWSYYLYYNGLSSAFSSLLT